MTGPIKAVKIMLNHFGIGPKSSDAAPQPKPQQGIAKKSNVVRHNEALKEALDLPKGKK